MAEETPRYTVLPRVLIFVFKDNKLLMIRYSGKGEHQTQEKADRKDIYNCIGGHVEHNENIIETAIKEAKEEAGIDLIEPKISGIINVNGFSGKNIMNFIVTATTDNKPLEHTLEGDLEWVEKTAISQLNVFPDMAAILEQILKQEKGQIFVGTAKFDGFKLEAINLQTY